MASIERLTQKLIDTTQPVATRRAAIIEIAEIGGEQALPFLLNALRDDAPGLRREAASALQQYNLQEVTAALLDAINSEENDLTLWTLIEVIGNIGTSEALTQLNELLNRTLSPLTRREIQKSIDLIYVRHQESVELVEHDQNTTIDGDVQQVESDASYEEHQQNEIIQENPDVKVEVDEKSDDTEQIAEILIEEDETNKNDVDKNKKIDDIEVSVIEETEDQEQELEGSSTGDSNDTVVHIEEAQESNGETESPNDLAANIGAIQTLGTSPALPVLVPNTSVVIYEQEDSQFKPSIFALVLRPNAYLSKRWVSRTRLFLVLLCLLIGATVTLVYSQVQRMPRSPYFQGFDSDFISDPQLYLAEGSFSLQQADFRSAIEKFEMVRSNETIESKYFRELGYAYFQEKQYASAIEAYEYYLQTRTINSYQPFVAEASFPIGGLESEMSRSSDYTTYNILGTAYKNLGEFHKARTAFESAIFIEPNEAEAYSNLAQLYSENYQQKNQLAEALAYTSVRLRPEIATYHDTMGWIVSKYGRLNRATSDLEHAIRLESDYVPAHYHLSEITDKSKNPHKSVKSLQFEHIAKIIQSRNPQPGILGLLTYIYERDSQKLPRLYTSILEHRGIVR